MQTNTVKTGLGTWYTLLSDAYGRLRVGDELSTGVSIDAALNNNDKTITVPASVEWLLKSVWVEYVSDGNAGNRQIVLEILDDSGNVIAQFRAGAVQAASITRYYMFAPNVADLTAFRDTDYLSTPIREFRLPSDYDIRVYDKTDVSALDDFTVRVTYESRSV